MKNARSAGPLIFFLCLVPVVFLILTCIVEFTKLTYVSQIDLRVFCALLSLLIAFFVSFLLLGDQLGKETFILIKRKHLVSIVVLLLAALIFMYIINFEDYSFYGSMVYQPWTRIPLPLLLSTIVFYIILLYVPAYFLYKVIFSRCRLNLLHKIAFYPIITMLIFGFVRFLFPSFKNFSYSKLVVPFLAVVFLSFIFYENLKRKNSEINNSMINVNSTELLGLSLIILFRLFLQFSAAGEINAFLKGDAAFHAANVAFIDRYGITGYMKSALTERYPVFNFAAWSIITQLLPLPYCNILVLTEFFNHIFATLTFYLIAKTLLGKTRESLFATLVLTIVSGFSWFYILTNPPSSFISGKDFYQYSWDIFNKFGTSSGAPTSTIYAGWHGLNRLWSLGLCFGFIAALLNAYKGSPSKRWFLVVISACFIQIALGHTTEILLLSVALFAFAALAPINHDFKEILATVGISTFISEIFALIFGYSLSVLLLIVFPFLAFTLIVITKKIVSARKTKLKPILQNKAAILNALAILFIFYYGLSWICFLSNYQRMLIGVPLFNLWYAFPIQWGFPGLLFSLTIVKITLTGWNKLHYCLKYALLAFTLLLVFTVFVDYANLLFFYMYVTNVYMPNFFIPFFALSSAFLIEDLKVPKTNMLKLPKPRMLLTFFLVLILLFGSFNHVISASYWKTCGWRKEISPLRTLTDGEIQLVNKLYNLPKLSAIDMCAYLPKDDPIPPDIDAVQYQKIVRYFLYDEDYLIMLGGLKLPQKMANDVLYKAHNIDELVYLKQFYPLNYLIVDRNSPSFLAQFLRENETPIFKGQQYLVYNLSNFESIKNYDLSTEGLILVDKVAFKGTLTLSSQNSKEITLKDITGEILPLDNGYTLVKYLSENNARGGLSIYDDQKNFWKGYGWGKGVLGAPILCENEKMQISGLKCTEVVVPPGNLSVSVAYHTFSEPCPDWSGYNFISIYLYGVNDLGKITVGIYGGGSKGSNAYLWYITDNFSGWKHFMLPLHTPDFKGSDFDITSIREIQIRWSTPNTRYIDKISVYPMEKMTALLPNMYIKGEISLINLRASANYFPEAKNVAQRIDIFGSVSFKVFNTFDNKRLYIRSFNYQGKEKIHPEPWHMTQRIGKEAIQSYIKAKDISILSILTNPITVLWALIVVFASLATLKPFRRIKIRFSKR